MHKVHALTSGGNVLTTDPLLLLLHCSLPSLAGLANLQSVKLNLVVSALAGITSLDGLSE